MRFGDLKRFWQKAWWNKLILIILGFFLWPFIVGGTAALFLISKVKNSFLKWILVLPILGFSILLGVAWVSAFVSPSKPKTEITVTPSPTLQTTITPSVSPIEGLSISPTPELTPEVKGTQTEEVLVTRVIDGDTIEIQDGRKIRYIGIDTPETVDPRKAVQCFGLEATNKNKELVNGKKVRIEKDVSETDKYGRFLRYVWVEDMFVNDYLVRQGYAQSYSYPPDIKYQDQFVQAQKEARENSRGLWGTCDYFGQPLSTPTAIPTKIPTKVQPTQVIYQLPPTSYIPPPTLPSQPQTNSCVIKGNISYNTDEKIYHVSGCPNYDATVINESKGERWFCSEAEAQSAGWRKAYNCP